MQTNQFKINDFKKAVGQFATGITIITTQYQQEICGLTVNSFSSVSLEPCLVLFCLNQSASSFNNFSKSDYFAVNILAESQQNIASLFAKTNIDKFTKIDYQLGKYSQAPLITASIASLECKKYQQIKAGDHDIFIGEVLNIKIDEQKSPQKSPLLYYAKSYRQLK